MTAAAEPARPDPDALLADSRAAGRARLRIYFGASPGVGKTYAMLEAAQRERATGRGVLAAVIETHGRAETAALLAGLELVPRRVTDHRGVQLAELDLDGVLARGAQAAGALGAAPLGAAPLVLVDELAHTNAPGSRHVKRWQDVLELLDAGLDVWTTLNVQHVASLGDVVEQITGVVVRETVPDAVLERADELELVDLAPDELLERLAAGKVYLADRAARAAEGFFARGNLLALRELALRRTAERVDVDVLAYRRAHGIAATWPTRERLVVCVGPSPASERLIRATKRMAEGLHAPWAAVHVELIGAPPAARRDREQLDAHLRTAELLGGEVVRLRAAGVAEAVLEHARTSNATRIVAGKPTHARWLDRLRGSLLDELIRGSGPVEVHVIAPLAPGEAPEPPPRVAAERRGAWPMVGASAAIAGVSGLCLAAYAWLSLADIAMLYVIAIMVASLPGRGAALLASTLAVVAFDLLFVPPRFTFAIANTRHLLTFVVMFGAGLAISTLTTRLRRQERDAIIRERRTAALLAFTREVAAAGSATDVAVVAARHLEDGLDAAAAVLVPEDGGLVALAGLMPLASQEAAVARWALEHRRRAGQGTDTLPGARVLAVPLLDGDRALGVLAIQRRRGAGPFDAGQVHLLDALARQSTLALARVALAAEAREAALRAHTEELRSSLLSAVSHDLRTPLAVITGAATTLRDAGAGLAADVRDELVGSIVDDARRLERVLANLIELTRMESGMQPRREWVPADELVGAALTRLEGALGDRELEVEVPAELALWIDPVLFEHVVINLVENALKHGAPPLRIAVRREGADCVIEVADRGPGLPAERARLFDKFVRASAAPGVGLGLAVVRAIVVAHGGSVAARPRDGGGAVFIARIPAEAA